MEIKNILDPAELGVALRLLRQGPADADWLTRKVRSELRDARITHEVIANTVSSTTLLLGRPDGRVCRLLDLLEGQTLTHRVTTPTAGRTDLWSNISLRPFYACAAMEALPLKSGGAVRVAEFGHDALVGPRGWLPDARVGDLLALRVLDGEVNVEHLPDGVDSTPERDQAVRATFARHIREEAWWSDFGDPDRSGELNRAFGHALLEDPDLLRQPVPPLVELLHDVLGEHTKRHLFDDVAAWNAGEVVSFGVAGMPETLYQELSRRAHKYGMSFDRFVVGMLGHAAWRTPFAEDLGPWEDWDLPEPAPSAATVTPLPLRPAT